MDLIFLNGNIITMTVPRKREQALAVKHGKIFRVGTNRMIEYLKNPETKMIDLKGKTVLPGFIDSHAHAALTGLSLFSARLESAASVADVCELIHLQAQKTASNKWVFGTGCVPWALKENRFPSMKELDQVSEGHPVYISSITFHSGAANTEAFKFLNIDSALPGVEKDFNDGVERLLEISGLAST